MDNSIRMMHNAISLAILEIQLNWEQKKKLTHAYAMKKFYRQKSRLNRLQDGDRNYHFSHSIVVSNSLKNQIHNVNDFSNQLTEP